MPPLSQSNPDRFEANVTVRLLAYENLETDQAAALKSPPSAVRKRSSIILVEQFPSAIQITLGG